MAENGKTQPKTDIETLLAAVDQQLLVKLLDSLVVEQMPPTVQASPSPEGGPR